ncbi:hypothetical protein [Humisphaera borealis]|uniref:Uncharacterized protein n=1 Tax=Humisphaera borealis TaxID=2807512 RepID=A0A7M2X2A0_9BACT|nr:hypothetical protein [Humisphaera borealis]QOV91794.1 hypothetical protein IPV69_10745 [Humisphaera borealis]
MTAGVQRIFSILTAFAIALAGSRCVCASAAMPAHHAAVDSTTVAVSASPDVVAGTAHACCATSKADQPDHRPAHAPKPATPTPTGCNHCKVSQAAPVVGDARSAGDGLGFEPAFAFIPLATSLLSQTGDYLSLQPTTDPPRLRDGLTLLSLHCSLLN